MLGRRSCLAILAFLACSASAQAPRTPGALPKTDFSGRWRMLKDQSDFHGFREPDMIIRVVDDHDPAMNVHTIQTAGEKTTTSDLTYFTDGSITKNTVNGRDAESKCYWDGPVLVVRTSLKTATGEDELVTDRWELSPDKQTLTISSHIDTDKGGVDMKLVMAREGSR
ncbi:MAG TPA: hypothetical protein VKX25_21740 [Bryobacteraceae bacterium]|jgi:hypothetical protein|nr:hypothetical protein [Bryobacteraceae bacterium]